MKTFRKGYYGYEENNQVMRFYHNEQLDIMTMKNNQVVLIVHDMKSGRIKTWKIKIDPDCDFIYSVQKTQIKTILTDMIKFADTLIDYIGERLAECAGFQIDYNYDVLEISRQAQAWADECMEGAATA